MMLVPLAALSIAACSGGDEDGTSITFNGETESGAAATISTDGNSGAMKIDLPGFKADIAMPKLKLDAGDFEMNGVNLYPGSTITSLNIADGGNEGEGSGGVTVRFAAPAAADVVRNWFGEQLQQAGFKLTAAGNALSGTTDEGKPFRMELSPNGAAASDGTITIGG
ncbi:hypothetical protein D1610_02260 [Sphingomonas gilva]|uniref:Uncharacterized protein n=2 Tax=Sphingomonas gilva TaxID=2305907 RepID=A0A396RR32_9SPHN|nr:hypothetical protein D1610_02260 [Sphingomonas gilva]